MTFKVRITFFPRQQSLEPRLHNWWKFGGGSAAAVAAGLSPLDLGNDIAGSIRQPAHFCGVFGLKPTDRRVPTTGSIPEVSGKPKCVRQMLAVGPWARSVEDLRLCFSLIAGADLQQPDVPPVPLDTPSGKSLQNLRVAWMEGWHEVSVTSETQVAIVAIEATVNEFAQAGVPVEHWIPEHFDLK